MKEKWLPLIFYLGLTIELLLVLYDYSAIPSFENVGLVFRLTFAIFALKVCLTKYSRKEWIALILASIFTGGMYLATGGNVALRTVVLVAAMRGIEIRQALKYSLGILFSGTLAIFLLSFFGIGRGLTTIVYRGVVPEERYCFGFAHPNSIHFAVLALVLSVIYVLQARWKLLAYALLFAINYVLFLFTDSRSGFLACALLIVGAAFFCLLPKAQQADWIYFAGMLVFVFCLAFSVFAAYCADSTPFWEEGSLIVKLDGILTTRISHLYWIDPVNPATLSSWTLFSDAHHFSLNFDMGWVALFCWYGIVPGLVVAILYLLLLNECRRQQDYLALTMIVVAAIYMLTETSFIPEFYLGRNCLLFLFGAYWGSMLKIEKGEKVNWWRIYAAKA
jgi:hypothetical protein